MSAADRITNQMRMQSMLAAGLLGKPRYGLVSDYDPATFEAKVYIQPENVETGWLPIVALGAGPGCGVYAAPKQNWQVMVLFQENSIDVGFVIGGMNSDVDPAPTGIQAGEIWVMQADGPFIKLQSTGINSHGLWNHDGDFDATGTVKGAVDVLAGPGLISGKGHVHAQDADGHGDTEADTHIPKNP